MNIFKISFVEIIFTQSTSQIANFWWKIEMQDCSVQPCTNVKQKVKLKNWFEIQFSQHVSAYDSIIQSTKYRK